MNYFRAMALAAWCLVMLTGCVPMSPLTARLEASWLEETDHLSLDLEGEVPVRILVERLQRLEVLRRVAVQVPEVSVYLRPKSTAREGIAVVEMACGGTLGDDKVLREGEATGEQRLASVVEFYFVRGAVSLQTLPVEALADGRAYAFSALVTHGFEGHWDVTQQRSYADAVVSADSANTVGTQRKFINAGVQFAAKVRPVPGIVRRVEGTLGVSAFGEGGVDLGSNVTFPINLDVTEGKMTRVMELSTANASVRAAMEGLGLKLAVGGDRLVVWLRVRG